MPNETNLSLGIMGGTFDPIHYGHLVTAECARHQFALDKVIFVPTGHPPHKKKYPVTDPMERLYMTRLAVASNPFFEVSAIEAERPGLSYTVDTVKAIRAAYPGARLYFITGADAILEIINWHNVGELLSLCNFIGATRPGYQIENLEGLQSIPGVDMSRIFTMVIPALAISSTDIRKRRLKGEPIKYLLPEAVEEYIMRKGLYLPK